MLCVRSICILLSSIYSIYIYSVSMVTYLDGQHVSPFKTLRYFPNITYIVITNISVLLTFNII